MMWVTLIAGALMFIANVETANDKTDDGATAFLYTLLGAVLCTISGLYLLGVVS